MLVLVAALTTTTAAEWNDSPHIRSAGITTQTGGDFSGRDLDRFSKRRAMAHLRKLAGDIGVRTRTSANETAAARYAAAEFRSLGYDVHVQKFSVDSGTSRNVVARWPGAKRYPFVVGGHMDTVPASPGANDNASGVAATLELARLVAGKEQARWITFVVFGSEEYGNDGTHHVGSRTFVNRLGADGRDRLAGMISVDMISDGGLIVGNSGIAGDVVARTLYNRLRAKGFPAVFRTSCDCSDNGPFEHGGISASYVWSGDDPDYHSSTDTVPNLDPADLARSGRAVRVFIKAFDKAYLDRMRQG
ncbi:MAG: aminopeptidase YwaD [Actinomycetota bacterium]|jgi:Zn-dependent M28 family amino/carboxypeptidase|nr:aminopeptidase YwaD [Actinomycetota bacterium]